MPSSSRPYEPGEFEALRARYPEIRAAQRASFIGAARLSAFSALIEVADKPPLKTATREEQLRAIEERGVAGALLWGDVLFDIEANRMATALYGEAVARSVHDPETAAALVPDYPFACKRPIIDQGYYETFNRGNVTLVDLRKGPITRVTASGIDTEQGAYELDTILYATGFDAITGALDGIEIRGRDGVRLRDRWHADGPTSYLGLQVAGFPNLFTIQGPASPSATTNFVAALEQHVEWIGECLAHVRAGGHRTIEAQLSAEQGWMDHATALVAGSIVLDPSCRSWYNGANVPGKARRYLAYAAGIPEYRRRCDEIAAKGYVGFMLA
jgi:cyclohexanone monooxygenase